MFDVVLHPALGLPVAEDGCCGRAACGTDEATPAATHLSVVSRLPLHHGLPVGLWMPSAGAWRNICQHDTNMIFAPARSREIGAMGQINRKGPRAAPPGQPEVVKIRHTWEVPRGQRAERSAQALFESLRQQRRVTFY